MESGRLVYFPSVGHIGAVAVGGTYGRCDRDGSTWCHSFHSLTCKYAFYIRRPSLARTFGQLRSKTSYRVTTPALAPTSARTYSRSARGLSEGLEEVRGGSVPRSMTDVSISLSTSGREAYRGAGHSRESIRDSGVGSEAAHRSELGPGSFLAAGLAGRSTPANRRQPSTTGSSQRETLSVQATNPAPSSWHAAFETGLRTHCRGLLRAVRGLPRDLAVARGSGGLGDLEVARRRARRRRPPGPTR